MQLSQLLSALPTIVSPQPLTDPHISHITENSRQVKPGALFVARRGTAVDGHKFISSVVEQGAVAIVCEDEVITSVPVIRVPDSSEALAWLCAAWHDFPARKLVMLGVTGTDGKTTTSTLLHSVLVHASFKTGLISTVNAVIGDQVLDTGLHTTTPDAPDVQRYLKQMVEAGMTHCVLETTSHGLAQHRVTACEFDVAVITNITHEHLDFHKTIEAYRAAKAKLFSGLSTAFAKPQVPKFAILNRDDWSFDYLRTRCTAEWVDYGINGEAAAVRATEIRYQPNSTLFTVRTAQSSFEVRTSLVGDFNISNCLAAISAALKLNLPSTAIQRGIAAVQSVPGRMERIDLGQDFLAIVDFAHTPNALQRLLQVARTLTLGKVIVVFGSAGLRDVAKRKWMGAIAAELADYTFITAEDPRTEDLNSILAESADGAVSKGGVEHKTFWRLPDRGEALQAAINLAQAGDVVLVCGKAHEQSMCFGTVEYPWDDRVALRAALALRLGIKGYAMPLLPTSKGWHE